MFKFCDYFFIDCDCFADTAHVTSRLCGKIFGRFLSLVRHHGFLCNLFEGGIVDFFCYVKSED